ncbi:HAD-like protein [Didymella exigua CBS 183.55]|uniref:Mitochondrial import inner membrane translocase subunit TIM50 n=1 Tax=Didymella exigua CBS 183.55 TaxID=1150837 RepID=A0A6A5RMT1_9PLEO|nr:HAD-like protein [Didymella exigua CBS 183.55]KAF1926827.1 HAD-like protein [Didymella exigua CBS 183.55]
MLRSSLSPSPFPHTILKVPQATKRVSFVRHVCRNRRAVVGRHDSASLLHTHSRPPVAAMNNNFNPWAQPFTPNYGYPGQPYDQDRNRSQEQTAPQGYSQPAPMAPWNANYGRQQQQPHQYYPHTQQPQQYYPHTQQQYNSVAAQQQAQAQAYYYQWAQYYGYTQGFTPINPPQQALGQTLQRNYPFFAPSFAAMQSQPGLHGVFNRGLQASTPLSDDEFIQVVEDGPAKAREEQPVYSTTKPNGRNRDLKIMLPAPAPCLKYMAQAAEEPTKVEASGRTLVVLDLNGTLLYRPNRNKRTMIARPFLIPFLRYLFSNFAVMVWSSARPENVASLVEQSLEEDLRKALVAQWGRDAFNLKPEHYNQNVQVYKNLEMIWSKDEIQKQHPDYENGGRFGQHNTVLIDDTTLKAAAQPHNLLLCSEFNATPEQMREDKLREIAGYLETLRTQQDVSKFMRKEPFGHGTGKWIYEWPEKDALTQETAYQGGQLESKVSVRSPSKKKDKKTRKTKKTKKSEAAAKATQAKASGVEQASESEDSVSEREVEAQGSVGGVKLF